MSFTSHNDPVLERLDAIAEATGVPIEMLFSFQPFESVADALRRAGEI